MTALPDIFADYSLLESEDRYRLLIELGRDLDPMPDALKTDATKVRGCSASVWVYPTQNDDGRLHFLADSNAAITKGVVALVLAVVQDRAPAEIAAISPGIRSCTTARIKATTPLVIAALLSARKCSRPSPLCVG